MARATYALEIDLDRDGTFGHALADVTGYVTSLVADYGMDDGFSEVAPPAELRAVLANRDGEFLPERASALYYGLLRPGPLVRLTATYNAVTYTLWTGRMAALDVVPGAWSNPRTASLTATDPMVALLNAEHRPPLQQQVTVDEALLTMFEANVAPWPYEDAPAPAATYCDFEPGRSVLAWVGDNAEMDDQNIVRAQVFARDVLPAEGGGRFFWDAPGARWAFHSREHDLDATLAVTLTDTDLIPEESEYVFGDRLTNRISFDFVPRKIGTPGSVIYTYPALPWLFSKQTLTQEFVARYTDPNTENARVGVIDPISPVAYTDFSATDEVPPHPKGNDDRTDRFTVTVDFFADRANVKVVSTENSNTYMRVFQLRGTPLLTFDRMTVTEENAASIDAYGLHAQPTQILPNIDDEAFARALAQWLIVQFSQPFGRFNYVTFEATQSAALLTQALARGVGDRVRLNVSHLSHEREYVIVGVRHILDAASGEHRCRWVLKPLPLLDFFVFDDDVYGLTDADNVLAL